MKWNKLIAICVGIGIAFHLFCLTAFADEAASSSEIQEQLHQRAQEQLDLLREEEFQNNIPEDAKELLSRLDWDELDLSKLISLSPGAFIDVAKDYFTQLITAPGRILGKLIGILLLCGIMSGLKSSVFHGGMEQVFSIVSVACTVSFIAEPIIACIVKTVEALRECSLFILSFIPIFGGVVAAGGNPVTGGTYNVFLFSACQIVSNIAADTLIPLLGIYFAFCVISPVVPQLKMDSLVGGIKSFVCWGLGIITTVFVGLLSLQTIVSTGADSVTMKTSKFLIGSFIPVIGGVLSDALSAAHGYLKLIKGVVGSFGMLVAAGTFLPVLIQVVIWYVVVSISSAIGNMLGADEVAAVLKSAGQTLSILLAAILCFVLLVIVSTTLMMVMCVG